MNLKHLTDKTLLIDTKALVARERELLTKILHHLKKIDKRKLYSDLGYSSLYDYCIRDLGYSEGSAHRRIQTCRLLAVMPEIENKIETGLLSLTNISQASQFFLQNDIQSPTDKKAVLEQMENLSKKEGEKMLFIISGGEKQPKDHQKRISKDKTRVAITLSDKTLEKCEELQSLLGKKNSYNDLIDYMVEVAIKDIEKKKFKVLSLTKVSPSPVEVKRNISNSVKGEVYLRDKKCVKCGSSHNLNFDHRVPFAFGRTSDAKNIRLLCFNCNQRSRMSARL